jgi:hypothetical protein
MKVITGPDTRWSFANVWEPKAINGGTPKYSVSLIIPKSDTRTVAKIKAAIEAAYREVAALRVRSDLKRVYELALTKVADDRAYHPIRDYLDALHRTYYQAPGRSFNCHTRVCLDDNFVMTVHPI